MVLYASTSGPRDELSHKTSAPIVILVNNAVWAEQTSMMLRLDRGKKLAISTTFSTQYQYWTDGKAPISISRVRMQEC